MASGLHDSFVRSIQALFEGGTTTGLTDAQLLDRFLEQPGEVSEQAFGALVVRHGPLVLDVCRGTLGATHDVEDAFQATFLVLARKARSVRRRDSLASWLFGVARRVAARARADAARRRTLERRAAELKTTQIGPPEGSDGLSALIDEVEKLPAKYRDPVILCYLQGLTYEAAAQRLGCPLGTLSIRLKRAREQLQSRLTRRGLAEPAGLFVAGHAPRSAVSAGLVASTVRTATRSASGSLAAAGAASATVETLTREVLRSMMMHKLNVVVATLASLALGAGLWAWRASVFAKEPNAQVPRARQVAAVPAQEQEPKAETPRPFRMEGSVTEERTGKPVAGVTFDVMLADSDRDYHADFQAVRSGEDGRFRVDLPPGHARAWTLKPPAGYWAPRDLDPIESFAVSDSAPVFRKDYVLRRGTVWDFRIYRDNQPEPFRGVVEGYSEVGRFQGTTDDSDRVRLTLPTEKGKVTAIVGEKQTEEMGRVQVLLEWEAGFRTDSVKSVEEFDPTSAQYRLTDTEGRTATLSKQEKGRVYPVLDGGKLTIRAELPTHDPSTVGDLAGQVVDPSGKPIEGARIALILGSENGGSMMSSHSAITDAQGRFRLRSIPRTTATGKVPAILLAVTKEGFAGVDTPQVQFKPPSADTPQVVGPIKLSPGITVKGTVVDPEGNPLSGAWVEPGGSYARLIHFTKTDAKGRFTVADMPEGMVHFNFDYGKLFANGKYLALRDSAPLTIKLRPIPAPTPKKAGETATPKPKRKSLPLGSAAPDWDTKAWSDGRARTLADYRGKVVFLDFWGVWCRPCVKSLPALETARAKYEARGVVFLTIHTPGEDETTVRKILELNHASLVFALDRNRKGEGIGDEFDGATAERYGVGGYPTAMIIDREGKVAFKTNDPSIVPATQAAMKDLGLDEKTLDEEKMGRIVVRLYEQALERVLDTPRR